MQSSIESDDLSFIVTSASCAIIVDYVYLITLPLYRAEIVCRRKAKKKRLQVRMSYNRTIP